MGLDMYLYAEKDIDRYNYKSVGGRFTREINPQYDEVNTATQMKNLPNAETGDFKITKQIAYWRKANAVHGWIVRNCADGVDECQRIYLDKDDLIRLRNDCLTALQDRGSAVETVETNNIVLDGVDEDIATRITDRITFEGMKVRMAQDTIDLESNPIPPVNGFFFGGTEKDEYYYEQLANTVEIVNSILAVMLDNERLDIYYQASW